MAGAAAIAGAFTLAAPAQAADTLGWSFAFAHVERCPFNPTGTCGPTAGTLQELGQAVQFGPDRNSFASVSPVDYAATKPFDYGTAFASASAGTPSPGAPLALPELHAYTSGTIVNADQGFSWNFASAQGALGFRNATADAITFDIGTFIGVADFTSSAPAGNGFVSASLAVLNSNVEDAAVGNAWYQYSNLPGQFGQFAADCSTGGAGIALSNPPALFTAASPGGITVAPTACTPGATTFTLDPGEAFYLWARLSTFRAADGLTDASNTFRIQFAPTVSAATQQFLAASLVQVPGLNVSTAPEPAEWALIITGFAGVGAALRRRRRLATA
jgi:hypothetical protein